MDNKNKKRPTKKEFEERWQFLNKELRNAIIGGKFEAGELLPSETELMEKSQLSRGSVRKLMGELEKAGLIERQRGRGTVVAEKMSQPIVKNDEILVLTAPIMDSLLDGGIPEFSDVRAAVLFEAVNNRLKMNGLKSYRISSYESPCTGIIKYLKKYRPLGAIALSKFYPDVDDINRIMAKDAIPVVSLASARLAFPNMINLSFDNTHMSHTAAEHLISMGHERIAVMTTKQHLQWTDERSEAFLDYCREEPGVRAEKVLMPGDVSGHVTAEFWLNMGKVLMRKIWVFKPYITAIFCVNDLVAYGAILEARKNKINIPRDLSVIGCGDDSLIFGFNITTVSLEAYKIGVVAADCLIRILKDKHQDFASARININPSIINHHATVANNKRVFSAKISKKEK